MNPFLHTPGGPTIFGAGTAATVADKTLLKKHQRILVVSDATVAATAFFTEITAPFGARIALVRSDIVVDGDCATVDAIAAAARGHDIDAVLAIGGGSVIDSAKGVVAVLAKNAPIASLEGYATIRHKTLPLVVIPTTAGTGSEATQFAVLKDWSETGRHKKRVLVDKSLLPVLGVLDPTLLVGLPPAVTAASAVDALTHAVEALASKMRNPIATALALEAVRILVVDGALQKSLDRPDDLRARGQCLIAAHLAGQAVSSAMLGACHALAHAVGAALSIPHGVANGLFLVDVMRLNRPRSEDAYTRLQHTLQAPSIDGAIDVIDSFITGTAHMPRRVRDATARTSPADWTAIAEAAFQDPDVPTNPVPVDASILLRLLEQRW